MWIADDLDRVDQERAAVNYLAERKLNWWDEAVPADKRVAYVGGPYRTDPRDGSRVPPMAILDEAAAAEVRAQLAALVHEDGTSKVPSMTDSEVKATWEALVKRQHDAGYPDESPLAGVALPEALDEAFTQLVDRVDFEHAA